MARTKKAIEITSENFYTFTPQQLFDEIERLRGNNPSTEVSNIDAIKDELRKANATIQRVTNALQEPKPRGRAAAKLKETQQEETPTATGKANKKVKKEEEE